MTSPILARLENEPILIAPENLTWFQSCVEKMESEATEIESKIEAAVNSEFWPHPDDYMARYRPYIVKDGILHIPVRGVLLKSLTYTSSWATGYQYIWEAFKRGMDDTDVRGIALVVDSPGGTVSGNFDLVDRMYERREEKPVRAFAADSAYSAAYSIASVAGAGITVSRSGGVGSIGVVTTHIDRSEALEKAGLKVTFIHAGKHKVDGNSANPLPDDVRARIQSRIDTIYDEFVALVARNRGIEERRVRKTEAATFNAEDSLSEGLADAIGALDDAVAAFAAEVSEETGDDTMSQQQDTPAVDQAAVDAAVEAARTEGLEQGRTEGRKAERERISAILDSDAAKDGRRESALAAALETDMSVEQASTFIARLPKDEVEAKAETPPENPSGSGVGENAFERAMNETENPEMGSGDGSGSGQEMSDSDLGRSLGLVGLRPQKQAQS